MVASYWWPKDGSDEWLAGIDGRLGIALLELAYDSSENSAPSFLEVGVWKGAWTSVMLKNVPGARGYGIDPYPGRPSFEKELLARLARIGVGSLFELFPDWEQFERSTAGGRKLDLIHIDGEHTEIAVQQDLYYASSHLSDRGVIVVDDYRHFWFPGIASAMYKFINDSEFKVLALTTSKAYLVRERFMRGMQDQLQVSFESRVASVWSSWREWDPVVEYSQPAEVSGQQALLVSYGQPQRTWGSMLKRWVPPILWGPLRKLLR
jgi:hypothetical protein